MSSEKPIYTPLPKDAETYHLQIIGNIQDDLKKFLSQDALLRRKAGKRHAKLSRAAGLLETVGTAVSIADGTIGATGVGVIAGGSLIGVGPLLGAGSIVALKRDKAIVKKLVKSEKLVSLAQTKLFSIQDKISKALGDEKISEDDFKDIHEEKRKYDMQRSEITENAKTMHRQSKNSSSTRDLADQLAVALKALKKILEIVVNLNFVMPNFPE